MYIIKTRYLNNDHHDWYRDIETLHRLIDCGAFLSHNGVFPSEVLAVYEELERFYFDSNEDPDSIEDGTFVLEYNNSQFYLRHIFVAKNKEIMYKVIEYNKKRSNFLLVRRVKDITNQVVSGGEVNLDKICCLMKLENRRKSEKS